MYTEENIKPEPFFIEIDGFYLHGDFLLNHADAFPSILFLHGSVSSGRSGFLLLRRLLLKKYGISSCAFDFVGHGSTAGEQALVNSCIEAQFAQASAIVDACFDCQPFGIVAADIHTDVALRLMEDYQVRHLLLLNPPDGWDTSHETACQVVTMLTPPSGTLAFMNANTTLLASIADNLHTVSQGSGNSVMSKESVA